MNLQVNICKCDFTTSEIAYLGYILTHEGIKPYPKKIEAIINLATPKTRKNVRRLLGMVQYYRDLWQQTNTQISYKRHYVRFPKFHSKICNPN